MNMQDKSIRIAHVTEAFAGGVATYMRLVLPKLVQQGFDVTFFYSQGRQCRIADKALSILQESGVKLTLVPMSRQINPLNDLCSLWILYRKIHSGRFDLVHTHCSKGGALGRIAAKFAGVKRIIHTPHCFAFLRSRGVYRRFIYLLMERMLSRLSADLIAVSESEYMAAIKANIARKTQCTTISNGLDVSATLAHVQDDAKRRFGVSDDMRVVTMVTRLVEYKGIDRFIRTAQMCSLRNVIFILAGDGSLKQEFDQKVSTLGLEDRVRILGHVDNIDELYRITDVALLCSDSEGHPYALLEAMQAGCAVVASDVPGNRDIVIHGQTGYLTSTEPSDIACAVEYLLKNHEVCRNLAKNAQQTCAKHYSLENQISRLVKVYRSR